MNHTIAPIPLWKQNPATRNLKLYILLLDSSGSAAEASRLILAIEKIILENMKSQVANAGLYLTQILFNQDWTVAQNLAHITRSEAIKPEYVSPSFGTALFKTLAEVVEQVEWIAQEWRNKDLRNTADVTYCIVTDSDVDNMSEGMGVSAMDVRSEVTLRTMQGRSKFLYFSVGTDTQVPAKQAADMGIAPEHCLLGIQDGKIFNHLFL